ncbi:MAG: DEAD/DEAH box helicase [Chloroflexia bacterium]|nr:DEAD/DEAH box helicase [Chloroflexia bacterium]
MLTKTNPEQQTQTKQAPEQLVEPENALPPITLEQLSPPLREAVARAGWPELMPVQARALPYLLAGRDLMVQSRTGSGKTGAFILPMLERLDPQQAHCQALVLTPTRELARQVERDARLLAGDSGIRTVAVYGGVSYKPQLEAFRQGAHLVVGTPGRVLDHLLRRSLSLKKLRMLVFDEADRMLSMGFYPDMKELQRYLPSHRINAYMFSATFTPRVMRLAGEFLHDPDFLSLSRDRVHVTDTEHVYYIVPPMEKDRCLVRIIEVENPDSALVFCNTRQTVHYVATVLRRFGYNVDELSSDRSQDERERIMARMREGKIRFLVTTDVAARGIDLPDLSHVVIYEPPEDKEDYIHRAGRTGRAGASGVAITLVSLVEKIKLDGTAKMFDIDMQEWPLPSDEDVAALAAERATVLLEAQLRARDRLKTERMQRFVPLARSLSQSEEGLELIAMLLDDAYQASLGEQPAAEEPAPQKKPSSKRSSRRGRRRR